jgi:hypothetical protein
LHNKISLLMFRDVQRIFEMKMKFLATASLLCLFSVAASATMITGSVNFGSPVANLSIPNLNSVNFVGTPSFTVITPGTGSLGTEIGSTGTALSFSSDSPISGFFVFGTGATKVTVDVSSFSGANVWSQTNLPNGVSILGLGFNGIAHEAGFTDTAVVGSITAQYASGYSPTADVAWSGNLTAPTPEPLSFLLFGSGFLSMAIIGRCKLVRP